MSKLDSLIKVAGNPKTKRYWQILKRLYKGTDDAVEKLKKSRDFGIYHGTDKKNIKTILSEGMKKKYNVLTESGKGNYFGSRDLSEAYAHGFHELKDPAMLRLKYPNELLKKEIYPKPQRVFFNDSTKRGLKKNNYDIKLRKNNKFKYYGNNAIPRKNSYYAELHFRDDLKPNILTTTDYQGAKNTFKNNKFIKNND